MRALQAAAVTFAVLVTAGSVFAQNDEPGRGGPPGGRGGRGGFGRGMMDRNSYMGLLRMEEVRDDLSLSEEQNTKIRDAGEELRDSVQPPDIDFANLRDAPQEEQVAARAKMQEFGAKVEKEARTKLAGILDETQMKRLRGLWVQRAGAVVALNDGEIATELKLTDEQKKDLVAQRDEQRGQFGGGFGGRRRGEGGPPPGAGGGGGPEGFRERMEAARKASEEKALGALTEEQKTVFTAIKGDEFEFPAQQFGRGRGGPGGGGRGEGDGNGPPRRRGGPGRDAA